jgi:Spy/CpxP family protein refolding chaperone
MTREMGKWWENPETAQKLALTDNQVQQLNQTFYNHKLKLIDYGAAMSKEDFKLQTLLDADQPNESQVSTQVDQVLAARGKLEREYTMMNLDLRKVLSVEQWKQLKTIRGAGMPGGPNVIFHQRFDGPGAMGGGMDGGVVIAAPPPGGGLE